MGDKSDMAESLYEIGEIMKEQKQHEKAISSLQGAYAVFKELGDQFSAAVCAMRSADVLREINRQEEPISKCAEAYGMLEVEDKDPRFRRTRCLREIGEIRKKQGFHNEAIFSLEGAYAIVKELGD
ncbi:hypothetical protein FRB98_007101, partial [Tulasnella sp. 332]